MTADNNDEANEGSNEAYKGMGARGKQNTESSRLYTGGQESLPTEFVNEGD